MSHQSNPEMEVISSLEAEGFLPSPDEEECILLEYSTVTVNEPLNILTEHESCLNIDKTSYVCTCLFLNIFAGLTLFEMYDGDFSNMS